MLSRLVQIFNQVQTSRSTHEKYMQILMGIYEKSNVDDFIDNFIMILRKLFEQEVDKSNDYIKRALEFLAKFSAEVVRREVSDQNAEQANYLQKLLQEVFPYCDLNYLGSRYYSCSFIMQLLNYIGGDVNLDNAVCDMIQEAMLKRLEYDHRLDIRLQAISALSRLQSPTTDCPVIEAYLKCLNDQHNTIRRSVIGVIVLNAKTLPAIRERINDIDAEVRCKAYVRLANIGPLVMYIRHRLHIMWAGLNEDNRVAKRIFKEQLLTKWLMAYDNDYTKFIQALTLSSTEIDLSRLAPIGKKIFRYLFESALVDNLLESLPIDSETKLVKDTRFDSETVLYWYYLVKHFRSNDEYENYLQQILPDLTEFCHYIERIFNEKYILSRSEIAEFEFKIHSLVKILNGYDFAEQVGRQTTLKLVTNILHKYRFHKRKLTWKLVKILSKCSTKLDALFQTINEIIINVREPLIEVKEQLCEREITDRKFKIAHCHTRIIILEGEQQEAIKKSDFKKAGESQVAIDKLQKEMEDLQKQFGPDLTTVSKTVRVKKTDDVTICYYLDILIGLMRLNRVQKVSPVLTKFMEDLLMPVNASSNGAIHSRYLECLILYCVINRNLALKYYGDIFDPILSYKHFGYSDLESLKIALMGFADLLCIYGPNLMKTADNDIVNTTRRLIEIDSSVRRVVENAKSITFPLLLDATVAILDIEDEDVIIIALKTLCKLVKVVDFSAELISHILLKWFHPKTEKNKNVYTAIGFFIEIFIKFTKNAIEIIRESLVPVLSVILSAPNDYPLTSVNLDSVLNFFITLINSADEPHFKASVFDIFEKISDDSNKKIVQLLSKILFRLNVTCKNIAERNEYMTPAEIAVNKIEDKVAKRYLEKFISKLKNATIDNELPTTEHHEQSNDQQSQQNIENETTNNNVEGDQNNNNNDTNAREQNTEQVNRYKPRRSERLAAKTSEVHEASGAVKKKPQTPAKRQIKRKKSKKNTSNIEPEETPVSSTPDRNVTVITEDTSDTDHANTPKVPIRKSLRLLQRK